jgi:hypothetical protein
MASMKRFVKENSLSLFFLAIFLLALCGQAIAGHNLYNEEQLAHGEGTGTESDKDQMVGKHAREDSPRWARAGDLRTTIYSNSLIIVMALVFFGSWFAQSVTGMTDYNQEQHNHGDPRLSWWSYVGSSQFWESTLQNWQSEFLAVGSFAILAVYLRQRGSPESKPVGAPIEDATGQEG